MVVTNGLKACTAHNGQTFETLWKITQFADLWKLFCWLLAGTHGFVFANSMEIVSKCISISPPRELVWVTTSPPFQMHVGRTKQSALFDIDLNKWHCRWANWQYRFIDFMCLATTDTCASSLNADLCTVSMTANNSNSCVQYYSDQFLCCCNRRRCRLHYCIVFHWACVINRLFCSLFQAKNHSNANTKDATDALPIHRIARSTRMCTLRTNHTTAASMAVISRTHTHHRWENTWR